MTGSVFAMDVVLACVSLMKREGVWRKEGSAPCLSGAFIFSVCSECFFQLRFRKFVPVFYLIVLELLGGFQGRSFLSIVVNEIVFS